MKLLEPTQRPSTPEEPRQEAASEGPSPRRPRQLLAGALVLLGLGGVAATGLGLLLGDRAGHEHAQGATEPTVVRPVGKSLRAKVKGGSGGVVRLNVNAEAPARSRGRLGAIPAGAPAQLSFSLPSGSKGKAPKLVAHRLETSLSKAMMSPHQGNGKGAGSDRGGGDSPKGAGSDHHGGGAAEEPKSSEGEGAAKYAETLALDRSETFLFNRGSGEVMVPNLPGGSKGGGHDHATDHTPSGPGQGLAQTIVGGGFQAALRVPPGAAQSAADPAGRFLVAAYPEPGRLEVIDLLRRKPVGRIELDGRPGALAFSPDGRLWVADEDAGRVLVVDVAARRVVGEAPAGEGKKSIAFGPDRALVASEDGSASLIDVRGVRTVRSLELDGRPVAVAYAKQAKTFAVADDAGTLTMISPTGTQRNVELGRQIGTRAIAIAPDGRTAVAANVRAGTLSVVDLQRGKVVGSVKAGRAPSEVVFLGRFAVARNAGSPDLTWVDVEEPSRSNNIPLGKAPIVGLSLTADGRGVLAASPADKSVFKLHEMMGRPMVEEQIPNISRADTAVASSGGLERVGPRGFEQRTVIERPGAYHLELSLPGGGTAEFELPVAAQRINEARVRAQSPRVRARVGKEVTVRFRVEGSAPKDAQVLAFSTGEGMSQLRVPARATGTGTYEARLTPPARGSYRLELLSEQSGLRAQPGSGALLEVRAR